MTVVGDSYGEVSEENTQVALIRIRAPKEVYGGAYYG